MWSWTAVQSYRMFASHRNEVDSRCVPSFVKTLTKNKLRTIWQRAEERLCKKDKQRLNKMLDFLLGGETRVHSSMVCWTCDQTYLPPIPCAYQWVISLQAPAWSKAYSWTFSSCCVGKTDFSSIFWKQLIIRNLQENCQESIYLDAPPFLSHNNEKLLNQGRLT